MVAAPGASYPLYPCKGCIAFLWIAFSPRRGLWLPIPVVVVVVVVVVGPFLVVISSLFVSFLSSLESQIVLSYSSGATSWEVLLKLLFTNWALVLVWCHFVAYSNIAINCLNL